jgi:hypothetical protein
MSSLKLLSSVKHFSGDLIRYEHESKTLNCTMKFHVFLPPTASSNAKLPVRECSFPSNSFCYFIFSTNTITALLGFNSVDYFSCRRFCISSVVSLAPTRTLSKNRVLVDMRPSKVLSLLPLTPLLVRNLLANLHNRCHSINP